ncbi:MAG: hypothetical protein R2879_09135 [Saprospiraceae bacterium]
MTQLFFRLFILAVLGIAALPGCYYDNEEDLFGGSDSNCDTTNVTFAADVNPIIISRCYQCHENGAEGGGIILASYAQIKPWIDNGRLIGSIKQLAGFSPMPKSASKIPDCEINTIEAWINSGYPDN